MEKNGNFLETGSYNGHYYGTPKPLLNDAILKDKAPSANDTENSEQVALRSESNKSSDKNLNEPTEEQNDKLWEGRQNCNESNSKLFQEKHIDV